MFFEEGSHPFAIGLAVSEIGVAVAGTFQQPQLLGLSGRLIEPYGVLRIARLVEQAVDK